MTNTAERVLAALQSYSLQSEGDGKYRCNSPLRPGSNSHAFTLTIHDGEHGAYKDWASEEQGSLYDLAKRLNIPLPESVASTKRKYEGLSDYARAHGMDASELQRAGWREVTIGSRPALEFETRTGKRLRFLDGEKPHYKSPPGYKKCWYGAERAIGMHSQDAPLVIANGEISVVAAQSWGVPALCVTAGEAQIPGDLLTELSQKLWVSPAETTILIALDCDDKGRASARQMKTQLAALGYRVRALNLGLGSGGDLADFCMLHGEHALAALKALPDLPDDASDDDDDADFEIIDITQFDKLPPVRWIIEGEIPEHGFVTIFGESNVGKSFIALDYALKIAQKAPVLYVALEGESGIPLRVYGWCQHHNVRPDSLSFKLLHGYVSFFDKEEMNKFLEAIKPVRPYLIVVDTFGLIMGSGDENSAANVNQVMKAARRMQVKVDCTIVFIHHTNKGGVQERGSGALRGRMDTMIQVLPDDDLIRVESSKTRDQKPFEPKSYKLLPVAVEGKGETLVPVPAEQVIRENDLTPDQRKVLEVLAMPLYRYGISQRDLAEISRLPYGRVVRALNNLMSKDFVSKPKSTRENATITNDGRMAIGLLPVEDVDDGEDDDELDQESGLDRKKGRIGSGKKGPFSPSGSIGSIGSAKNDGESQLAIQKAPDPVDPIDPIDPHEKSQRSNDPIDSTEAQYLPGMTAPFEYK